ncbi:MAG TPA: ABC transporter substrate-binding protein [Isosphaeraceae bacterium]|nr:ABC transporter substrate-binding protein [Isosphaeraceae bacterium]
MNASRFGPLLLRVLVASSLAALFPFFARQGSGQEPGTSASVTVDDPLRSLPFDRITLSDDKRTVLLIEPVSPRPLPPLDAAKAKQDSVVSLSGKSVIPEEGNIGLPGEPSKFQTLEGNRAKAKEDEAESSLKIHLLLEAEVRDFRVKRINIKMIEYFEDMLLAQAEQLTLARDFTRAFECYLRVKMRNPAWPGLDDRVNRLLFAEGSTALIGGDQNRGLRLLRELLQRRRDFPGLLDRLASAYNGWISQALELGQFAKGRRFLHELAQMAPEHPAVGELRSRFVVRAQSKLKDADSMTGLGRLDALCDVLRIWPTLEGAEAIYRQAFEATPTLDVAVSDVPRPVGPWVRTPADLRVSRLLYRPIMASDTEDARSGKVSGQLAAAVESSDLGRQLSIRLQPGHVWSDGTRQVAAVDVARALIDRSDPSSPKFQARWADLVDRVAASADGRVDLRLKRPLLKLGAWLDWPVAAAHAGIDGRIATSGPDRQLISDGPFVCGHVSDRSIELLEADQQAAGPAPGANKWKIRRLRETRYATAKAILAALTEGEVSLIAHVPPDQVRTIESSAEVKIGRYSQPILHLIALDARNPLLRNRSLRRALSYAIDRRTLLEDTVLKQPADESSSVSDGPFPKESYANAPGVRPLEFNSALALMLVAAARKEMSNAAIELKFEYPASAIAQEVVPRIAEAFRSAGIRVEIIERPESALEADLRAGRRFDLAYRVLRCDEPILDAGPLLCPGYDAPPEADALASSASLRILQLLLQLERAADLPTARGLAIQIDREARDELPVLPLWQVVDHYAWRPRLKGPGETADRLYEGIESWEIEPWFARDPWTGP